MRSLPHQRRCRLPIECDIKPHGLCYPCPRIELQLKTTHPFPKLLGLLDPSLEDTVINPQYLIPSPPPMSFCPPKMHLVVPCRFPSTFVIRHGQQGTHHVMDLHRSSTSLIHFCTHQGPEEVIDLLAHVAQGVRQTSLRMLEWQY
jgi:hypothetical protein